MVDRGQLASVALHSTQGMSTPLTPCIVVKALSTHAMVENSMIHVWHHARSRNVNDVTRSEAARARLCVQILQKCDIVTTPGSGFGPAGEGFVRASAFAHRYASCWLSHSTPLALSRRACCVKQQC